MLLQFIPIFQIFEDICSGKCSTTNDKGTWTRMFKKMPSGLIQLEVVGQRSNDESKPFSSIMIDDLKLQKCEEFSKYIALNIILSRNLLLGHLKLNVCFTSEKF